MFSIQTKILSGLILALALASLWYRGEALKASADAQEYKGKAEAAQIALAAHTRQQSAVLTATKAREVTRAVRREANTILKKEDTHATTLAIDWADQPIPAVVLERLRVKPE